MNRLRTGQRDRSCGPVRIARFVDGQPVVIEKSVADCERQKKMAATIDSMTLEQKIALLQKIQGAA